MAGGYGGLFDYNGYTSVPSGSVSTLGGSIPRGSYLIVSINASTNLSSMSISDSGGGTWVTAVPYEATNFVTQTWIRTTVGNGSSPTISLTGTSSGNYSIILLGTRYTGVNGTVSSSVSGAASVSTAVITSPATTSEGDVVFSVGTTTPGRLSSAGSGYTLAYNLNILGMQIIQQYQVATTVGTSYTTQFGPNIGDYNKISSFVIKNTPATPFAGWGIPLI
jgi:hypothetical protein